MTIASGDREMKWSNKIMGAMLGDLACPVMIS